MMSVMKRLRRDARILKAKAIASLRRAASAHNSYEEEGRSTTVLLHLQHAFEMLFKAGLVEKRVRIFDPQMGRSISFEKAIKLGQEHLRLSDEEAGTARAVDALRDDEQHWYTYVSEGILYAHARAGITLFDDVLQRIFGDRLTNHLPTRVLPLSAEPPRDIQLLIDEEYSQIAALLQPGKRQRAEARARIRTLLAMEAHVTDGVRVSEKDVNRVQRAVVRRKARNEVFPRLSELAAEVAGEGATITVRFVKKGGAPVRYVRGDDRGEDVDAAFVREVDLQKRFHLSAFDLADRLNLTRPRGTALRRYLKIDDDPSCRYVFNFGGISHVRYSDNAYNKMKEALDGGLDMDDVWRTHRPGARKRRRTA
jgi:hypothetical protein